MTGPANAPVPPFATPAQPLTIASEEGITLAATYWPSADKNAPAILMLHGNGGNRRDVAPTAEWLNAQGYAVLAIDFRGQGASTPSNRSFGLYESADAHAAFDWLKAKSPDAKIGVIGFSLGGAAALIGNQGPLQPDVLVLESVYPDIRHAIYNRISAHAGVVAATLIEPLLSFQSLLRYSLMPSAISPVTAIKLVKCPIMVVGGGADLYTPRGETEAMFQAAHKNGEIWFLEGLSHDQVVADSAPEWRQKLLTFLDKHLKKG